MDFKKYFIVFLTAALVMSCSEYQKALKSKEIEPKYKVGSELYEKGLETKKDKYFKKSIRLFEQILPQYQGKPQGQLIAFKIANAYYKLGDHIVASYKFKRFVNSYPASTKVEEAFFKSAKSLYELSPRYSLDQKETRDAVDRLQSYINKYQDGKYFDKANQLLAELQDKLEKKRYEIAKQYHHRERYKAAIESFDNFLIDFPGAKLKEKALFYKFESAYLLAINSIPRKIKPRLEDALQVYEKYREAADEPSLIEKAKNYKKDIDNRLNLDKILKKENS